MLSAHYSYSYTDSVSYRIHYEAHNIRLDKSLMNNSAELDSMMAHLSSMLEDTTIQITQINIIGHASPIGSYQFNVNHVNSRLGVVKRYIRTRLPIADSLFSLHNKGIAWDQLLQMVDTCQINNKEAILEILSREPKLVPYYDTLQVDQRYFDLRRIDNLEAWNELNARFFKKLQYIMVTEIHYRKYIPFESLPESRDFENKVIIPTGSRISIPEREVVDSIEVEDLWQQRLHLKSNGIGWIMLAGNGAVELELSRHWSINLPVYYSGLDYFTREIKFKTLTIQPEVRYWFKDGRNWFAGAHLGIGWFNYALNGEYRIQDCGWDSPALGGGFSGGYRMNLTKNGRWRVEFSLGVGVYDVRYDKFRNTPDSKIVETVHDTWFGIDQAAVSFIYSIGLNKWTR